MTLVVGAATVAGDAGVALAASKPRAAAHAPVQQVGSTGPSGPAEAQDEASALLMARLQDRAVEVLADRTDASQTFAHPDGSLSYSVSALPSRVRRGAAWVPVDATLRRASDGSVAPAATESALTLSGGGGTRLATMTVDGRALTLSWPSVLPAPTLSGATATYPDVLASGVDLEVTATVSGGIEETLVVENATAAADPALSELALTLSASPGLTVGTDGTGNTTVKDSSGRPVITSPAPVMWDSSTDPAASASTAATAASGPAAPSAASPSAAAVSAGKGWASSAHGPGLYAHRARVRTTLSGNRLQMVPDKGLLTGRNTHYPVFIDPTFVTHSASGSTLHFDEVQQGYPTTSNWGTSDNGGLGVGYQGFSSPTGIERTFVNLSIPSAIYGAHILSANLNTTVSKASASGSNSTTVNVFSMSTISSSTTWNNQPTKNTGGTNPNYPDPNASKTFTTTSQAPNLPVTFDMTSGMQTIADIHNTNWTLGLYNATETNDLDFVRFADNPTFSITYDAYAAASSVAVSPSFVDPYNGHRYATSLTPVLSAKITDADAPSVKAQFEVTPNPANADTTYTYTGTSAAVASGGTAKLTVPSASAFPVAVHLRVRVRGYDGSVYGPWSGYLTFNMNTTPPNAPSITCDQYSRNTWAPSASGGAQCTFTTTSGDGMGYAWGLDDPNATERVWDTVDGSGGKPQTVTITPADGWHRLYARTVDSGGNISAATTEYDFGVGTVGLTSPADGDRPARRVGLGAIGQSSYTGVTYQYRQGETDTWHDIPAGDVSRTSDGSAVTWPVAVTSGSPAPLTWNITSTLPQDSPVDIRAAFTDGTTTAYTQPHTITVDRNAGTAPTDTVGPGDVNDLTGDFELSATDASGFGMSVTRTASSRRPAAGSDAAGQDPIYGPQWTSGTTADLTDSDWSYLHTTSKTSVGIVDADGDETGFTATTTGGWKPEPGAEDLTLTGSTSGSFTLKDQDGTTTTFAKVGSAATTWQVSASFLPTSNSTTTVVSEAVTVGGATLARPAYVIAPTTAVAPATCQTTPSTAGCRMLQFVYATSTTATASAFGDYAGRVSQIKEWATSPGATAATATVVAQYAYDTSGRLRQEWDPRISPALKTAYDYDGAGRVTTLTPPGELPWTMAYGNVGSTATAGDGMLLSVSRPTLTAGTQNTPDGGTATTSVVYDVPLTGSGAPNAMGPTDVAAWGQSDVPADATAVFPADSVPSSHEGTDLQAGDYARASVTYTDASGRDVNEATPGGHLTTTEFDRFGNTVRQLTAANRELALASDGARLDELKMLDIDGLSTAGRAEQLSTTSVYSADGLRETDEYGPLHLTTLASTLTAPTGGTDLPSGSVVPARQHTANTYDQGRPTDGTATVENQITSTTVGASVPGYPTDGDQRTGTTAYDWAKGLPTTTVTDPAGLKLTKTTSYDSQGRVTRTTLPKSDGTDAGATVTAYYTATGTGTCGGHPEWADLVCTVGPGGAITGGGTNPAQLPTRTTTYDRWGNPLAETDTSGSSSRTTTSTYDAAGRLTKTAVTGGLGTAVPDQSTTYDPATGQTATTSAGGETVTHTYDALGREVTYNDGSGNTATTAYDALDRPTRTTDSAPSTTTYTYDTAKDPRGLETSRTDSVAGTFTAAYDSDGDLAAESLPGGYTLTTTQDETGAPTSRVYTRDSDGAVIASDDTDQSVHGQTVDDADTAGQTRTRAYTYDAAGRLSQADDTAPDGTCTRRSYGFDPNSNRTTLATSAGAPAAGCDSTGATTTSTPYDSADRLTTTGTAYDAFGRTTTQASGAAIGYYTDDLVHQQTAADGTTRQTWTLDAAQRLASWTTETDTTGTWTRTAARTNHYGNDTDSPDWTAEDTAGTVTRDVQDIAGGLAATTEADSTDLLLTDIHGDVTVRLPLDPTAAPTAQAYDEFGNPEDGTTTTRYGWLGGKQRSSETVTGATLMGVRLYDPTTGRFLSTDPVPGGSANAYDYCNADPVNCYDLAGQWPHFHNPIHVKRWYRSARNHLHSGVKHSWRWTSRHLHLGTIGLTMRMSWHGASRFVRRALHNHFVRQCMWWGMGSLAAGGGNAWRGFVANCVAAVGGSSRWG